MKILVNGYLTGGNCPPFIRALSERDNEVYITNTGEISNGKFKHDPVLNEQEIKIPLFSQSARLVIRLMQKFRIPGWTSLVIPEYKKLVQDLKPDLIVNHKINIRSNIMLKAGKSPQVSYIYGSEVHNGKIRIKPVREALEKNDYILTNTEEMKQFVIAEYPGMADKVKYLPWGYPDFDLLEKTKKLDRSVLRRKFGISDSDFLVFDSRSLRQPGEALNNLLEGFRFFAESHNNARICLVRGFLGVPKAIQQVREFVHENPGPGERILLLDGTMNREEYMELLRLSDVFISLLPADQFGFSILEAALLGMKLALTDLSVYRRNLGDNPVYIQVTGKENIHRSLERCISEPAVPGPKILSALEKKFNYHDNYDRINDFFHEIIHPENPSS